MDPACDQPMATRLTRQALPLHLFASFLFLILLPTLPVAAQAPPAPKWSSLEEALGKEDYAAAKKLADAIVQRGASDDRTKAAAVYGRILLGLGQTDSARQYLAMQAKQGFAAQQGAIYAAWLTAQCGKPGEAAQTLEAILRQAGDSPDEAVAEAADVLAMLYMARDDMEKAKQTVDFGLKVLQYRGVKDGYLLALLRNRLASNFTAGAAKRLYDQAEKLRKEAKFQPAGRVYMQVFSLYPGDEYGHASGFRMGQCLETLGRRTQAEQHWTEFVSSSPAGPWRGQARVALVHLLLASGDLEAAGQQAAAAHHILSAGVDEPAAATWNRAAAEIHLCQGIVALLEARHAAAAAALGEAKDHAVKQVEDPSGRFLAGLARLIDHTDRRSDLIPAQLAVPDEKFRLALSLGVIYNVLGRFEQARDAFDHVLRAPMRLALQPHRSFAALGQARALVGHARDNESAAAESLASAKDAYLLSLGSLPDSAWHDEALHDLAVLIEDVAERHAAARGGPDATATRDGNAAREQARATLVTARSESLPHWRAIIERYPNSPRCDDAMFRAGSLLHDMADVAPAAQSEKTWQEAQSLLHQFTSKHPKSAYTGEAFVRQIDIALEKAFDPKAALALGAQAGDWARWAIGSPKFDVVEPSLWASVPQHPNETEIRRSVHDCLLRLGIVAYLSGEFDKAAEWVEIAGPKPPPRTFTSDPDMDSITLHYLLRAIRGKKPVTEQRALKATATAEQRLVVQLGDLYLETVRPEKAEEVYLRIARRDPRLGKISLELEGYTILQLSVALDRQPGRRFESLDWLERLADKRFAGTHSGGYGLFRKALYHYNLHQDPSVSFPLYQQFMRLYPDHPMRESAHYYAFADACQLQQEPVALELAEDFRKRYPNSQWLGSIETRLNRLSGGARNEGANR